MKINKYPDGSSYVEITDCKYPRVFKINTYEDLWHLNQYVDACTNDLWNGYPNIIIPNLIDAQADRRFKENQSTGLKLVCKFLNQMQATFTIFHPHNAEVVEALLNDVVIMDNKEYILKVLKELSLEIPSMEKNLILMSSDAGGFKPLMKLCDQINWKGETYSASKFRKYEGGESKLLQLVTRLDFEGKDILIVDDICVYGGTFKGLAKLLRARNCGKLYLAVSHMTVKNLGEDPVTNYFDKVFTTNSKYDNYCSGKSIKQPKNLEIIKLF